MVREISNKILIYVNIYMVVHPFYISLRNYLLAWIEFNRDRKNLNWFFRITKIFQRGILANSFTRVKFYDAKNNVRKEKYNDLFIVEFYSKPYFCT